MKNKKGKTFVGKHLVNSRITIDYSGEKPSVKFGYPSKKESVATSPAVLLPAMVMAAICYLVFTFSSGMTQYSPQNYDNNNYPSKCNIYTYYKDSTNTSIDSWSFQCEVPNEYRGEYDKYIYRWVNFEPKESIPLVSSLIPYLVKPAKLSSSASHKEILQEFLFSVNALLALLFLLFFWIIIFSFIFKYTKWGNLKFPVANRIFSPKRWSAKFTTCPESKVIEIPLFKNIHLDYRATGEFAKYLVKIEIKEHPFLEFVQVKQESNIPFLGLWINSFRTRSQQRREEFEAIHPDGEERKVKWKTYKKKKINVWLWQAKFYFKEIPKKGFLETRWD